MKQRSPSLPAAVLAALFVVLFTVAGCTLPGANAESDKGLTLRIGATSVTGTPAGSLGWGDREGILQRELAAGGVTKIEYSFFQSGKDVVSALLSGAVDVAAVGDNPALSAKGNGADVELLSLDSVSGDTWLIGRKGGPTRIEELIGATVTAPVGTIRDRSAKQLIEQAGLTGQIEVKDVPTPESIAGLSSGSIDATLVGGASAVDLERQGFPVIDKTSNHELGSVGATIATADFVRANPDLKEAWQNAITATNADVVNRLDEYTAWVAETDGLELDLVREATRPEEFNTEPFPPEGLQQLTAAYEFLAADGTIAQQFDVTEWAGVQP